MLINDIVTLKEYIPTIVSQDFKRYERFLVLAEEWLSRELTGKQIIEGLELEGYEVLKIKCQDVVAYKAYIDAIPMLDLVETDTGFAVTSDANLAPASKDRVAALREGLVNGLTDRVESLLEYLESSVQFHDDWKASKAYSLIYDTYIFSLTEFRRFAPFTGGRLAFIDAKPAMKRAIKLKIEPVISQELSDQIIEQLRDDDLSAENDRIIDQLRYAFAYFVTGDDKVASSFLIRAKNIILKNLSDYPAFETSELYARILSQQSPKDGAFLNCGL